MIDAGRWRREALKERKDSFFKKTLGRIIRIKRPSAERPVATGGQNPTNPVNPV